MKSRGVSYGPNHYYSRSILELSVSDPPHLYADPDPRIRFRDNGYGSDLKSSKFQFVSS